MKKTALRAHYLDQRTALAPQEVETSSLQWMRQFISHVGEPAGKVVAGYYPTRGEVDVLPLLGHLAKAGITTALPVTPVLKQALLFRRWEPGAKLKTGTFSIKEPVKASPTVQPDVLIVPLLAFDETGNRLGYGGGYYDRTIAQLRDTHPSIYIVGAAYDFQKSTPLPIDDTDQPLDAIITESRVYTFS